MLLAMHGLPTAITGRAFSFETTLFQAAIGATGGTAFGTFMWYWFEARYRKQIRRRDA